MVVVLLLLLVLMLGTSAGAGWCWCWCWEVLVLGGGVAAAAAGDHRGGGSKGVGRWVQGRGAVGPRARGGGSKGEGRWVQGRGAAGSRARGSGSKGEGRWRSSGCREVGCPRRSSQRTLICLPPPHCLDQCRHAVRHGVGGGGGRAASIGEPFYHCVKAELSGWEVGSFEVLVALPDEFSGCMRGVGG